MNKIREEDIQRIIQRIPYKELEGKNILITGANGFIGSYIVDTIMYLNQYFFQEKSDVFVICRNSNKLKERFKDYLENSHFHPMVQSIEEKLDIDVAIDYVLHAAGSSSAKVQKESPVSILKSNVIGTYNLLEFVKQTKLLTFLFFSSGAVYGKIPDGINNINESDYFNTNFMETNNCYTEGKRMAEHLCYAYAKEFRVPIKNIRISHTYGPGIDLEDGHVYSDFVGSVCRNDALFIRGTGNSIRPFCYITDAVVAIFLVMLKGKIGEAYNMANNENNYSIRELAEVLIEQAFPERKLSIKCNKSADGMKERKIKTDTTKLQELGWNPEINVVEGFRRTVKSFEKE